MNQWHLLFGRSLKMILTPVGIEVRTEVDVSGPPRADILLLRHDHPRWTPEQLAVLPDGIRHSRTAQILIEFKYSESVNEDALAQALIYDRLYRTTLLKEKNDDISVRTFLVSSKTLQPKTLQRFGLVSGKHAGVFRTRHDFIRPITLISLNDLADNPHNAAFKLFASKRREQMKAIDRLKDHDDRDFQGLVFGLSQVTKKDGIMTTTEMTPDFVIEVGKRLIGEQLRQAREEGLEEGRKQLRQAREEGLEEGRKQLRQAREEGRSEILDLLKQGLSNEEIIRKLENPSQT